MNGKQLKNSILQWAIQGKLVPQDPNDEPASVLLERIRAEKKRLIKEGKIKKDKNESIIYRGDDNSYYEKFADGRVKCLDEEIPFEIPRNWEWARLGCVVEINPRNRVDESSQAGFIPMAYIDAGYGNHFRFDVRKWEELKSGFTHLADGDVAFAKITPCFQNRKSMILAGLPNGIAGGTTELNVLRVFGETLNREFLLYVIKSHYFIGEAVFKGTAGQQRVRTGYTESKLIPIPPFSEQRRIVGKINEVLPVAEKYELSQNHLDCLNSLIRERLKKSILQEAIQGKLVHQDSQEGSASELLVRIHNEKQKLLSEGKLRKKDIVDSVIYKGEDSKYYENVNGKTLDINEEIPFDIPDTWNWVRLGSIVSNEAGLAYSKDSLADKTPPAIRVLRGGNIEEGRWAIKDDDVIISKKYVKESLLLRRGTFITPAVTSIERMAKTALIEEDQADIVVGGFVLMMKPFITDNSLLQYLNLFFQTTYFKKYCISITNKSGQAFYNLSRQKLMQCFVPLPPEGEQVRIANKYTSLTL